LSETIILENLSFINDDAGILDKAEKYYRQSLSLEPGNPRCMNNFAYFLFNHDRNINEGMELIDKALELIPGNSNYLDTKAWGLYKQGKNKEAIDILEKNWNLYHMYKTYFPLQEVKKAVANQKQ
jgi:Tfp pilus assembly protein PilF